MAAAIALVLLLPVLFHLRGVRPPVLAEVIGMGLAPLSAAVSYYLRVVRVGFDSTTMIVGTPLALALGLTAHALIRTKPGGWKCLLAITAAARRWQGGLL
jgi:hypothetical protein